MRSLLPMAWVYDTLRTSTWYTRGVLYVFVRMSLFLSSWCLFFFRGKCVAMAACSPQKLGFVGTPYFVEQ